jgi:hypothetical protein
LYIKKYQGITSSFTRTEVRGAIKREVSNQYDRQITPKEEESFMNDFEKLTSDYGIGVSDSNYLATYRRTYNIFLESEIAVFDSTTFENALSTNKNYKWRNIGAADAMTLNLAILAQATKLATFDLGFEGVNIPDIDILIIPNEY